MSDQAQEVIEEVVETPEAPEAPEALAEAPPVEQPEGDEPPAAAAPEVYSPDFSYKVYGEEKTLPDFLHPLLTGKDKEDLFREKWQKSEAFDVLKEKHEKAVSEHNQYQEGLQKELAPVFESIQQMKRSADINDYDGFFKAAGVKPEDVFKWAVEKAQYNEMTPQERDAYDKRIATLRENSQLKYENEQTTAQMQDYLVQQRERELFLTLEDPGVNQIMQEFDARKGRIGAFRDEIVAYANGQWYAKGEDISPKQAVEGVLGLMGRSLNQGQPTATTTQTNSATPAVVPPRTAKPTIPTMRSGHASPVKRAFKSLEEMRQAAEQIQE